MGDMLMMAISIVIPPENSKIPRQSYSRGRLGPRNLGTSIVNRLELLLAGWRGLRRFVFTNERGGISSFRGREGYLNQVGSRGSKSEGLSSTLRPGRRGAKGAYAFAATGSSRSRKKNAPGIICKYFPCPSRDRPGLPWSISLRRWLTGAGQRKPYRHCRHTKTQLERFDYARIREERREKEGRREIETYRRLYSERIK